MNRQSLVLTSLVTLLLLSSASGAQAATVSGGVTVSSIRDLTGNSSVPVGGTLVLLSGHAYNVTMDIGVSVGAPNTDFHVTLNPGVVAYNSQDFWRVHTTSYKGYNATTFTPGTKTATFSLVQGNMSISATFEIPLNVTTATSPSLGSLTLHFPIENYALVTAAVPGGSQLGVVNVNVSDQTIQTYNTDYAKASTYLSSGQISPSYSKFVNGVLAESQALAKLGLPDQADSLLGVISPSSFPQPPSYSTQTVLIAAVVVAVLLAAVFLIVALKGRGKSSYSATIAGEVRTELAVLEVTASKYDKALADRLKALKDKLGEAR